MMPNHKAEPNTCRGESPKDTQIRHIGPIDERRNRLLLLPQVYESSIPAQTLMPPQGFGQPKWVDKKERGNLVLKSCKIAKYRYNFNPLLKIHV